MAKIKLIQLGEPMANGTIRYQAQLSFFRGDDVADFIIEDSIMKVWQNGENGFGFYQTNQPYEIVSTAEEMRMQEL